MFGLFWMHFHKDSKYSNQIPECCHFLQMCYILVLSSAHARRIVSVNIVHWTDHMVHKSVSQNQSLEQMFSLEILAQIHKSELTYVLDQMWTKVWF